MNNEETYLPFGTLRTILWRSEMVLLQGVVCDDIVVDERVLFWLKVPWFLLWVVWSALQALQFVLEIEHVVGLLVSKRSIFVFSQSVDKVSLLSLPVGVLLLWIAVNLSYRIIFGLPSLILLVRHFLVFWSFTLEVGLVFDVGVNIVFPVAVVVLSWEENFIRCCLSNLLVLSRKHSHFVTFVFDL